MHYSYLWHQDLVSSGQRTHPNHMHISIHCLLSHLGWRLNKQNDMWVIMKNRCMHESLYYGLYNGGFC